MPWVLLSLFILMPMIEIGVFIEVGGIIGLWPTLAVIVLTAVAGSALIRHQGLAILGQAQHNFAAGRLPVREIFDGICLLLAGAFLLTPGFITDTFGALLLIPAFRNLIRTVVLTHFLDRKKVWRNGGAPQGQGPEEGGGPATIEGKYTVSRSDREPHQGPSVDDS
jgi:UPF0716 protein FxsA